MVKSILDAKKLLARIGDYSLPIRAFECVVPEDWTDFNGHMNEARYLDCFSNSSDCIMQLIGCDEVYIQNGKSFFTVETHICHLDEVRAGQSVYVSAQILQAKGKKLHLFHSLFHQRDNNIGARDGVMGSGAEGEGDLLLATGEQMLLHVDLDSRRTSEPDQHIASLMGKYNDAHKHLPLPDAAGRAIRQKK